MKDYGKSTLILFLSQRLLKMQAFQLSEADYGN